MPTVGVLNELTVLRLTPRGAELEGGLLLPVGQVPMGAEVGQTLGVFVHYGPDNQLTATTVQPLAQVGEVAWLKVTSPLHPAWTIS